MKKEWNDLEEKKQELGFVISHRMIRNVNWKLSGTNQNLNIFRKATNPYILIFLPSKYPSPIFSHSPLLGMPSSDLSLFFSFFITLSFSLSFSNDVFLHPSLLFLGPFYFFSLFSLLPSFSSNLPLVVARYAAYFRSFTHNMC